MSVEFTVLTNFSCESYGIDWQRMGSWNLEWEHLAPDETHSLELPSHSEPSLLMEVACLSVSETNLSLF